MTAAVNKFLCLSRRSIHGTSSPRFRKGQIRICLVLRPPCEGFNLAVRSFKSVRQVSSTGFNERSSSEGVLDVCSRTRTVWSPPILTAEICCFFICMPNIFGILYAPDRDVDRYLDNCHDAGGELHFNRRRLSRC